MNAPLLHLLGCLFLALLLLFALGASAAMFRHPADGADDFPLDPRDAAPGSPVQRGARLASPHSLAPSGAPAPVTFVGSADHAAGGTGFDTAAGSLSNARGSGSPRDPRV